MYLTERKNLSLSSWQIALLLVLLKYLFALYLHNPWLNLKRKVRCLLCWSFLFFQAETIYFICSQKCSLDYFLTETIQSKINIFQNFFQIFHFYIFCLLLWTIFYFYSCHLHQLNFLIHLFNFLWSKVLGLQ